MVDFTRFLLLRPVAALRPAIFDSVWQETEHRLSAQGNEGNKIDTVTYQMLDSCCKRDRPFQLSCRFSSGTKGNNVVDQDKSSGGDESGGPASCYANLRENSLLIGVVHPT